MTATLVAPLANILMPPAVPYAMFGGMLALVGGLVSLALGQAVMLVAWPFLHWLILMAEMLSHIPGASVAIPSFSGWWVWGYYAAITGWYVWSHGEKISHV